MTKQLVTLAIGVLLGAGLMYGFALTVLSWPPATPQLAPVKSIRITPHPWEGIVVNGCQPLDIPADKLDLVIRLLTPGKYYGTDTLFDHITPIVAEAQITHIDGSQSFVIVRDGGVNPAMVSVDGHYYFYGRSDPDIHAGGTELFRLLGEVAQAKSDPTAP
jgi:hypothetical protein